MIGNEVTNKTNCRYDLPICVAFFIIAWSRLLLSAEFGTASRSNELTLVGIWYFVYYKLNKGSYVYSTYNIGVLGKSKLEMLHLNIY